MDMSVPVVSIVCVCTFTYRWRDSMCELWSRKPLLGGLTLVTN